MNGIFTLIRKLKSLKGLQINFLKEVNENILKTVSELSDKISSLQKVIKKLLETVFELKKASETARCQYFSHFSKYFLSSPVWIVFPVSFSFSLLYTSTTTLYYLGETKIGSQFKIG